MTTTTTKPPWPANHKGHWWSGWPGAHCLKCGSEDPMEIALADNKYDAWDNTWASEADKLDYEKACICPYDQPR